MTVAIRKERNELAGLEKQFEAGEVAEKEYGQEKVRLTKSITENSRQLTLNTNTANAAGKSIAAQRAELARLTDAYVKAVNPTKAEAKAIRELSDNLKAQEKELGNNTRNVGNYGDQLKSVISDIPVLGGALRQAEQALTIVTKGFNVGSAAVFGYVGLIGTAAVAALSAFFKATDEGADFLERVTAGVGSAFQFVTDRAADAGKAIYDVFFGDTKLTAGSNNSIAAKIGALFDPAGAAQAFANGALVKALNQQIEDSVRDLTVEEEKLNGEVEKALLLAKDRSKTEQTRFAVLEQVGFKEEIFNAKRKKAAEDALKAALVGLQLRGKEEAEITDEEKDHLNQLRVEVVKLDNESAVIQQKIQNRKAALQEQIDADAKKAAEEAEKQKQLLLDFNDFKRRIDEAALIDTEKVWAESFQRLLMRLEKEREAIQIHANKRLANDQKAIDKQQAGYAQDAENKKKYNRLLLEDEQKKFDGLSSLASSAQQLNRALAGNNAEATDFGKSLTAFQIGLAAVETMSKAISSAKGATAFDYAVQLGIAIAAAVGAIAQIDQLFSNVGETPKPQFGGGGKFVTKGPQMIMVGDNPGGMELVTVEPLSGKGQTKIGRGANLLQLGGGGEVAAFGNGQFASQTIINQVNNQVEAGKQIVNGIEGRIPVLVVENYERVKGNMQRVITQSTI